jgi:hypothetical protein
MKTASAWYKTEIQFLADYLFQEFHSTSNELVLYLSNEQEEASSLQSLKSDVLVG